MQFPKINGDISAMWGKTVTLSLAYPQQAKESPRAKTDHLKNLSKQKLMPKIERVVYLC